MAPGVEPVQGAPRKSMPDLASSSWTRRLEDGLTVLASTTTRPFCAPSLTPLGPEDHGLRHRGIAHAEENALGMLRHFGGRRAGFAAGFGRQFFGLAVGIRPERDIVAGLQKVAGHGAAHQSQSEKSEFCHK